MNKLIELAKEGRINENASIRDQHSIVINAPIQKVWNLLVDIKKWNEWNPSIVGVSIKGEKVIEKVNFSWRLNGYLAKSEIQKIDEPNVLSWTGISRNVKRIYVWQLESDDNQTIVTLSASLQGILIVLQSHQKVYNELIYWLECLKKATE